MMATITNVTAWSDPRQNANGDEVLAYYYATCDDDGNPVDGRCHVCTTRAEAVRLGARLATSLNVEFLNETMR
jgi:hypothetical protein